MYVVYYYIDLFLAGEWMGKATADFFFYEQSLYHHRPPYSI